jgi:hypothetical protein
MKNGAYVNLISYENIEDEIWCGVRTDMVGVHKNKIDVGVSIFLQDVADHSLELFDIQLLIFVLVV